MCGYVLCQLLLEDTSVNVCSTTHTNFRGTNYNAFTRRLSHYPQERKWMCVRIEIPTYLARGYEMVSELCQFVAHQFWAAFQIYVALNFMSPPEIKCLISSVKSAVICSMLYLLFMASQRAIIPLSSTCAVAELLWRIPGQLTFCLFVVNVPNLLN